MRVGASILPFTKLIFYIIINYKLNYIFNLFTHNIYFTRAYTCHIWEKNYESIKFGHEQHAQYEHLQRQSRTEKLLSIGTQTRHLRRRPAGAEAYQRRYGQVHSLRNRRLQLL